MKITKLGHSCLLVEMPEPVNRTVLFDPGTLSTVDVDKLEYLDDIFITHGHGDHCDPELIKKLVDKFPDVRIFATAEVIHGLKDYGIKATNVAPQGVQEFDSPHAPTEPLFVTPQEHGIHYLEKLTHPGDSHEFRKTMPILALPVQAPWGSTVNAVRLALALKPRYVIPIHDWHWSSQAQEQMYANMERLFKENGITFIKAVNGEPFVLEV